MTGETLPLLSRNVSRPLTPVAIGIVTFKAQIGQLLVQIALLTASVRIMAKGTVPRFKGLMLIFFGDLQILVTTETDTVLRLNSKIGIIT
jgi:hypothetical protein